MSRLISRGALIVFEGCDRSGKSTQCKKLVEALNNDGIKAKLWRFPDRDTAIGVMISRYLEQKCELEDHAIHLLFTANRWEAVPRMMELLSSGTTLVVDRYAYSGVAFSSAKQGLDMSWCKQPEVGLPKPDAVLFLQLTPEAASERADYGKERYEQPEFQDRVADNYKLMTDDTWKMIDASQTIDELHTVVRAVALEVIEKAKGQDIGQLWTSTDQEETEVDGVPRKKQCNGRGEG
ncbi:hypothetical protein NP493_446g01022 [Ridgeia piscesae]|uniref:Thymidylate kinase n=1 Tax=Ridgeia piscesae TaxID=27915 RepID=A0AAD9KZN9_RIDPI|nr:hypothetical protein NP493_446g01022 [Ridgeia piscesae]